ncbi:hypothetical protein RRG08_065931 [Elysia crispata]|uniref:Uncharacterized protein n=1 Tax=Elysia crispata TaxID=231223 RepID=A0AAE0ZG11_9GAST|nr:hypothetical protein RRG08_065931 [Elysia crispata]
MCVLARVGVASATGKTGGSALWLLFSSYYYNGEEKRRVPGRTSLTVQHMGRVQISSPRRLKSKLPPGIQGDAASPVIRYGILEDAADTETQTETDTGASSDFYPLFFSLILGARVCVIRERLA